MRKNKNQKKSSGYMMNEIFNLGKYNIKIISNTPSSQAIKDFNRELAKLLHKYN